jgi:hypothetical protein
MVLQICSWNSSLKFWGKLLCACSLCAVSGANLQEVAIRVLDGGRDGAYYFCIAFKLHDQCIILEMINSDR